MSDLVELPLSWTTATIADVAEIKTGKLDANAAVKNGLYPFFTCAEDISRIDCFSFDTEAVLLAGNGFFSVKWHKGKFDAYQRTYVIEPDGISGKYLFYAMLWILPGLSGKSRGSTIKYLRLGDIKDTKLHLPAVSEQTRIVEKLEELLSDLDAGVAELKAAQKKLARYRQALLKAAVEGALTAEWRAERARRGEVGESGAKLLARILSERCARWQAKQLAKSKRQGKTPPKSWQDKYPEPVQPDTTNLPELPEEWVWTKVGLAGQVQLGRQRAPQYHTGENMVPYLRVANVFEDRIDVGDVMEMHFSPSEEETFRLSRNDILLNEGQSLELVGRSAIYRDELPRACFTNTLIRFRAEEGVATEFAQTLFLHYLYSGRFRKIATITTNIAHLGAGRMAEVEFPLPSKSEQIEIVRVLREVLDRVARQQEAIVVSLKQSAAQRKNLLKAAFSGQLVPQDPNDEPATLLLERIRAERAGRASGPKTRGRKAKVAA